MFYFSKLAFEHSLLWSYPKERKRNEFYVHRACLCLWPHTSHLRNYSCEWCDIPCSCSMSQAIWQVWFCIVSVLMMFEWTV